MNDYRIIAFKILASKTLPYFFFLMMAMGFAQDSNHQKDGRYVFSEVNLNRHSKELSEIYSLMGKYYEGVELAKPVLLEEVFHPNWFMRDTDTPEEATLNVESKQKFKKRVSDHGPYPGYAVNRKFASVGLANDNVAFVRMDKKSATSFFLYKIDGKWSIMDKLWTPVQKSSYKHSNAMDYTNVDNLINNYLEALNNSDTSTLSSLLHKHWDKKAINNENKLAFKTRNTLLENPVPTTFNPRGAKLFSIDLYHGKLAIVRVDFMEESTTTFFICFKMNAQWTIVGERTTIGS